VLLSFTLYPVIPAKAGMTDNKGMTGYDAAGGNRCGLQTRSYMVRDCKSQTIKPSNIPDFRTPGLLDPKTPVIRRLKANNDP